MLPNCRSLQKTVGSDATEVITCRWWRLAGAARTFKRLEGRWKDAAVKGKPRLVSHQRQSFKCLLLLFAVSYFLINIFLIIFHAMSKVSEGGHFRGGARFAGFEAAVLPSPAQLPVV